LAKQLVTALGENGNRPFKGIKVKSEVVLIELRRYECATRHTSIAIASLVSMGKGGAIRE